MENRPHPDAPGTITMQPPRPAVIAVLQDLIFGTMIRSTAQSLGIQVLLVRNDQELARALAEHAASLVIIDLNTPGDVASAAIATAKSLCPAGATTEGSTKRVPPFVMAYVSHVDEALANAARKAGADEVLPRSRFHAQIRAILQHHAAPR